MGTTQNVLLNSGKMQSTWCRRWTFFNIEVHDHVFIVHHFHLEKINWLRGHLFFQTNLCVTFITQFIGSIGTVSIYWFIGTGVIHKWRHTSRDSLVGALSNLFKLVYRDRLVPGQWHIWPPSLLCHTIMLYALCYTITNPPPHLWMPPQSLQTTQKLRQKWTNFTLTQLW